MKNAALCLVLCALCLAPWVYAQTIPVHQEPHHRTQLYTAQVRIFDVDIPPGAITLNHRHELDIATVAIANGATRTQSEGREWSGPRQREVGSVNVTQYAGGAPGIHRIENIDKVPYRLIAVENQRPQGWSTPALLKAPGTTLNQQTRAFAVYDVRLDGATMETTHAHEVPAVAVLMSGMVENQGGGGETPFRLQQPGRWLITPMGQGHTLRVPAGATAHIVEFEAR